MNGMSGAGSRISGLNASGVSLVSMAPIRRRKKVDMLQGRKLRGRSTLFEIEICFAPWAFYATGACQGARVSGWIGRVRAISYRKREIKIKDRSRGDQHASTNEYRI